MPVFRKPTFPYAYDADEQIAALRAHRKLPSRAIPEKTSGYLLLATWNIANFGAQERLEQDHRLIAEILSWFDLVAIQEVRDDLAGLRAVQRLLPDSYRVIFTDPGGNDERYVFLYDSDKVTPLEKFGELTVPHSELRSVRLKDVDLEFRGFDRNPALGSFRAGQLTLLLANVHLYFGSGKTPEKRKEGMDRRCLEAFAIARWADRRRTSDYVYTANIIALGDFNLPKRVPGDRVFDALTAKGLVLPAHSTKLGGSNLNDDAHYDQMALFPGPLQKGFTSGVFDFDGAVFADLWSNTNRKQQVRFRSYVRYYLSDHRPLWARVKVSA